MSSVPEEGVDACGKAPPPQRLLETLTTPPLVVLVSLYGTAVNPSIESNMPTKKAKTILAWHFLPANRRLCYGDGREVKAGEKLTVDTSSQSLSLCEYGLHASKGARDAVSFRRGTVVCRVRLSGDIIEGDDKCVASERTVLWMADAEKTLRLFAAWCATRALKLVEKSGRKVDPRSWAAVKAAQDYANGKIDAVQLRAAAAADARKSERIAHSKQLTKMLMALKGK